MPPSTDIYERQQLPDQKKQQFKPWSIEDDDRLRILILDARSIEAIARVIGRTPSAIRKRASKMKLPLQKM
jgi:hypothetical protein